MGMVEHLKHYGVIKSKQGTGNLTACFAVMVGPEGRAVGVEHIPELVSSSIENIQKSEAAQLLKEGSLSVHAGDGRLGWPEFAPYDAIHVGAAAAEIPPALIELNGSIRVRTETYLRYVPLTSREAQLQGY